LVSNSTQQPKYFKNIFIFSGQPESAFGPICDAAHLLSSPHTALAQQGFGLFD
jgi:hypothetical protein